MAQGSFSGAVTAWVQASKERQEAVFKESAQRILEIAQTPRSAGGAMRVDTGFLRASLMVGLGEVNFAITEKPEGPGKFAYDAGATSLVISNATINDKITAQWSASYALYREYGSHGQPGDRFVGLAAQRWSAVVSEVCAEAQSRAGG